MLTQHAGKSSAVIVVGRNQVRKQPLIFPQLAERQKCRALRSLGQPADSFELFKCGQAICVWLCLVLLSILTSGIFGLGGKAYLIARFAAGLVEADAGTPCRAMQLPTFHDRMGGGRDHCFQQSPCRAPLTGS